MGSRKLSQELEAQQTDEVASSDASFQQALQQLLQEWDSRISELQERLQEAEQQLVARQIEEATALLAAQAAVQPRHKFSPALLNMRHIERTLAFQKEFAKADKVKQQADQLELLELSQLGADIAGKQEAERAHLAAKHSKEREAASKKASSAVLAAQQRRDYEVEQLTRRHQAAKLSLSRGHAAQRLSLQQGLRGSLGLARPTKLLGLPSFNSSLTETRGLVPDPAPARGFEAQLPPPHRSAERCRSPLGASGLYGARAAGSPPASPPAGVLRASLGVPASGCSCAGRLGSPGGRQQHLAMCRCGAVADAAAAAAGYGLAMPPLAAAAGKKGGNSSGSSRGARPCTRAGTRVTQSGSFVASSGGLLRRSSSGDGSLPSAARAAPAPRSPGSAATASNKAGSLRGTWGSSIGAKGSNRSAGGTTGSSKPGTASSSRGGAGAPLRATTSHSDASSSSSSSSIGPWQASNPAPRSRLQSLQGAAAQPAAVNLWGQDVPGQHTSVPAVVSDSCATCMADEGQSRQDLPQQSSNGMAPEPSSAADTAALLAKGLAHPAPAVSGDIGVSCQGGESSSQATEAGAAAAHAAEAAIDTAQTAGSAALAEAVAARAVGCAAELKAESGSNGDVEGEHSNASYCSDFEEGAAEFQPDAAGAGDLTAGAATEPEPASEPGGALQEPAETLDPPASDDPQKAAACTGSAEQQSSSFHSDATIAVLAAAAGAVGLAGVAALEGCVASNVGP
uniref:Uncharacterized protein n=1 Tax=Tetradesmus obliquus TaxID=3088 RepID=A0A383VWP9_TETOB